MSSTTGLKRPHSHLPSSYSNNPRHPNEDYLYSHPGGPTGVSRMNPGNPNPHHRVSDSQDFRPSIGGNGSHLPTGYQDHGGMSGYPTHHPAYPIGFPHGEQDYASASHYAPYPPPSLPSSQNIMSQQPQIQPQEDPTTLPPNKKHKKRRVPRPTDQTVSTNNPSKSSHSHSQQQQDKDLDLPIAKTNSGNGVSRKGAATGSSSMIIVGDGNDDASTGGLGGKVKETMSKGEPVGEISGMKYFVDFTSLPFTSIIEYVTKNNILPPFGQTPDIAGVNEEGLKACDPVKLYSHKEPSVPLPTALGLTLPPLPNYPKPLTKPLNIKRRKKKVPVQYDVNGNVIVAPTEIEVDGRRGFGHHEDDFAQGQVHGQEEGAERKTKRRHTNTSMTAAVIQESITMAQEEEERRRVLVEGHYRSLGLSMGAGVVVGGSMGAGNLEGEGGRQEVGTGMQVEEGVEAINGIQGTVDGSEPVIATDLAGQIDPLPSGEPAATNAAAEPVPMDQDITMAAAPEQDNPTSESQPVQQPIEEAAAVQEEEDVGLPPSPKQLRRSGRKPPVKGTTLASVYRSTRVDYSPTPSISSSDTDYLPSGYIPILSDLETAKEVFRERTTKHWCEALSVGMIDPNEQKYKLVNGGQVPAWNPTMMSMVQMAGTGGLMKEADVIVDFLYAAKIGNRSLKIANAPLIPSMPNSALSL